MNGIPKITKIIKYLYILMIITLALSGFAQMPIFKRYYIADVPGLGWTARYYFTHYLHYLGAILFIALISYLALDFLLIGQKRYRLTLAARLRIFLLSGILITGIFRVLKNLPDILFTPCFTRIIDVTHLGFVIIFLFVALLFRVFKKGWLEERA